MYSSKSYFRENKRCTHVTLCVPYSRSYSSCDSTPALTQRELVAAFAAAATRGAFHSAMTDKRLLASLDLMRRMPPSRMENSLEGKRCPAVRRAFSCADD